MSSQSPHYVKTPYGYKRSFFSTQPKYNTTFLRMSECILVNEGIDS